MFYNSLIRSLCAEKRIYHGLPDLMTRVAREELDELGDDIDECNAGSEAQDTEVNCE